jgi:hypothetical protein
MGMTGRNIGARVRDRRSLGSADGQGMRRQQESRTNAKQRPVGHYDVPEFVG